MCNNVWGKGKGKRGEAGQGKVWLTKVRMETKECNGTDEKISEGGEKWGEVRSKQSI